MKALIIEFFYEVLLLIGAYYLIEFLEDTGKDLKYIAFTQFFSILFSAYIVIKLLSGFWELWKSRK